MTVRGSEVKLFRLEGDVVRHILVGCASKALSPPQPWRSLAPASGPGFSSQIQASRTDRENRQEEQPN